MEIFTKNTQKIKKSGLRISIKQLLFFHFYTISIFWKNRSYAGKQF